jgi:hypothetical protein
MYKIRQEGPITKTAGASHRYNQPTEGQDFQPRSGNISTGRKEARLADRDRMS